MSTSIPIPTTLLSAVNELLAAVGRTRVSSLETVDMDQKAQSALSFINSAIVEVQSQDWSFNTDEEVYLQPDTEGNIYVPSNCAAIRSSERSRNRDVTIRGERLYDRENHTFIFKEGLFTDIRSLLPFEELPQPIRWYVVCLAGRNFGASEMPDSTTYRFTGDKEKSAHSTALQFDTWSSDGRKEERNSTLRQNRTRWR